VSRTLTVYLAADLKKFSPALKGAEQDLGRFGNATRNLSNTLSGMLGPALIGAAAAAGYAAVQFGVDGVKAFVDDEAAAAKLATTLDNLGLVHDTTQVEAMIDALQRETGVADDALRPAFDRLVRSIGDTAGATDALKLAMDVSAGTGKSLDSVVQALGKAYDGNTAGLSRLGAGIDKSVLATGNMDTITKDLARTFGGQAKTASETYKGQLDRLSVGFSELQESFGAGFINALGNTAGKTDELMQAMEDLQPALEDIGGAAGDLTIELVGMVTAADKASKAGKRLLDDPNWDDLGTVLRETADANSYLIGTFIQGIPVIGPYINLLYGLVGGYDALAGSANDAYGGVSRTAMALGQGTPDIDANSAATSRWTGYAKSLGGVVKTTGGNVKEYFATLDKGTTSTGSATKETDLLTTAFDLQRGVVEKLQGTLDSQVSDLEAATQAARDYSTTLATQLLGGIDLGAAQQTGTDLGISTLDAFDRQIAEAEWFGNVLSSIKAQGADQMLIDQLASLGPAAGGALAQEMLDKGLVQTFSDRLVDVVAVANTTAQAMVPEFLTAGIDSAEDFVDGTIEQLTKEQARLKAIGKNVGKGIGVNIKAEIAEAVADAVRAANAAKTAAAAERAAEIAAQQVTVSEQQIAQALQRLIGNSNARAGYSMGVPVPTPVLG
jgi:hypothetical protein